MFFDKKMKMPAKEQALPGRAERMEVPERHYVNGAPLEGPFSPGLKPPGTHQTRPTAKSAAA